LTLEELNKYKQGRVEDTPRMCKYTHCVSFQDIDVSKELSYLVDIIKYIYLLYIGRYNKVYIYLPYIGRYMTIACRRRDQSLAIQRNFAVLPYFVEANGILYPRSYSVHFNRNRRAVNAPDWKKRSDAQLSEGKASLGIEGATFRDPLKPPDTIVP